jgi:hypothetical protein
MVAHDQGEFLIPEHRAVLEDRACHLDHVSRKAGCHIRRQALTARHGLGQRHPHPLLDVPYQETEDCVGERSSRPVGQAVVSAAEPGRDVRPAIRRAVRSQPHDVGMRQDSGFGPVRTLDLTDSGASRQ